MTEVEGVNVKKRELNIVCDSDTMWKRRIATLKVCNASCEYWCIHLCTILITGAYAVFQKPVNGAQNPSKQLLYGLYCGNVLCAKLCFPDRGGGEQRVLQEYYSNYLSVSTCTADLSGPAAYMESSQTFACKCFG